MFRCLNSHHWHQFLHVGTERLGWGLKFLRFESMEQMERGRLLHAVRI